MFQELDLAIFHLHWNCIWDLPENENVVVSRLTAVKSIFHWAISSKITTINVLHAKIYLIQNSHRICKISVKSFTKWHMMFWRYIRQFSTFSKKLICSAKTADGCLYPLAHKYIYIYIYIYIYKLKRKRGPRPRPVSPIAFEYSCGRPCKRSQKEFKIETCMYLPLPSISHFRCRGTWVQFFARFTILPASMSPKP